MGTLPLSGSAYFRILSATSWASISSNPTISLLHDGVGSCFNQKLIAAFLHSIIENCCCVSISSNFARGILIPQELLHSSFHFSIPSIALSTLSGDRTGEEALPEWWEWTCTLVNAYDKSVRVEKLCSCKPDKHDQVLKVTHEITCTIHISLISRLLPDLSMWKMLERSLRKRHGCTILPLKWIKYRLMHREKSRLTVTPLKGLTNDWEHYM